MGYAIRRLPVYIVVDCSSSMSGEPIEAVKQGIRALLSELRFDPQTAESAYLSVIAYASVAQQLVPLTALRAFREVALYTNGVSALGKALSLLTECIQREETQPGDYRPLVFLLTDGAATDSWQDAAAALKQTKPGNIIFCAVGAKAEVQALKQLTDHVVLMNTLSAGDLAQYFEFVSDYNKMPGNPGGTELPPPKGFTILP